MKLSQKNKTIIAIVLFVAIFAALVLIASFLDLQVSKLLTKGILKEGEYFATDFFGVLLECVGCIPIYLMIAFACCVLFWTCLRIVRKRNNALGIVLAVVCAIGVAAACWYTLKDIMGYVFEHSISRVNVANGNSAAVIGNTLEALDKFEHSAVLYAIEAIVGVLIAVPALFAAKLFSEETLKKLVKFIFATAVALVVANVLIMIIKTPIGRMRFRAINSTLGQGMIDRDMVQGYTPWYKINGQPNEGVLAAYESTYGVTDAFKSFPSGHTCSAGTVYALMMLPDLFEFKRKKGAKLACWIVPIVYVALVAISRIMVGAHYMSDVTFGGTIAFVCIMIAREIIVLKGKNVRALFSKKSDEKESEAAAEKEEAIPQAVQESK